MDTFLKSFTIFTIGAVLILSAVTAYQFLYTPVVTPIPPTTVQPNEYDLVQQAITATSEVEQSFKSGDVVIKVDNFMNGGKTFQDPSNPGDYILSADLDHCLESTSCFNNSISSNFSAWFDGEDGVFFVRLLEQPVGTARLDAEEFLTDVLKISKEELCHLTYYMSVSENVDPRFAGQHLLFSSCPEAQKM